MPLFFTKESYRSMYLQTAHWKNLNRTFWMGNYPKVCKICKTYAFLVLHHRHYDCLYKERLMIDVIPVCEDCHYELHFSALYGKTPLTLTALTKREEFVVWKHTYMKFLYIRPSDVIEWFVEQYSVFED